LRRIIDRIVKYWNNPMEVMSRAVVKTRTLRPLPGEISTERINSATLPIKIEAARTAIAKCTELPELLRYKSQAEGLAAAVRIMKDVGPEMIKQANELMADAWRKGGELLSQYSNVAKGLGSKTIEGKQVRLGAVDSDRIKIAKQLGITNHQCSAMVRVAKAPPPQVYDAVQRSHDLERVSRKVRPPAFRTSGRKAYSDAMRVVLGAEDGLQKIKANLGRIPLDAFRQLTSDERKIVKAKITEIIELLDEMDRLCK
jgi:hypothetical protein